MDVRSPAWPGLELPPPATNTREKCCSACWMA